MSRNSGMTIVETSFAALILGIVIIGALGSLYTAKEITALTKKRARAVQVLKSRMEVILASSYSGLEDGEDNGYLYNNPDSVPYTLTTAVETEYGGGGEDEDEENEEKGKTITLQLTWEQYNKSYTQELITYRRKE